MLPSDETLNFTVMGGLLALVIWTTRKIFVGMRHNVRATTRALSWTWLVIGAAGIAIFVAVTGTPLTLDESQWYTASPFPEIALFCVMLFGMVASYLSRQIEVRRAAIEARRKSGDLSRPPIDLDVWEFIHPLLVSIITYGVVLEQLHNKGISFESVVIAFQTGFFWQTILARRAQA